MLEENSIWSAATILNNKETWFFSSVLKKKAAPFGAAFLLL